jgi:hypothetical protein
MDNPEKLATWQVTGRKKYEKKTKKHHTIWVGQHYTQANTNKVNMTWALPQTTGGKTEPNNVLCVNRNGHHNTEDTY